jgi:hypothetical protein
LVLFVLFFYDAFEPKGKLDKGEMRPELPLAKRAGVS